MKRHGLCGLLLAVAFALTACGGGGSSSSSAKPTQTGTVAGTVLSSSNNQAVSNASLQFGSTTTSTDSAGAYSMTLPANDGQVIKITATNFADYFARVNVTANGTSALQVALTPVGTSAALSVAAGGSVNLSGTTGQVSLPANGLVDATTGAAATGNVTVKITEIDPTQNTAAMPAGFLARTTGGTQDFESFGVIQVDLLSSTGKKLQLATGQSATIRIPVNAGVSTPPSSIGLFSLDETTGLWKQEGTATLVGSGVNAYYQATVSHFSYWSVGRLISTVYVSGCVSHTDNTPYSTTEKLDVVAAGTDYVGSAFASVTSNGTFRVAVKTNAEAEIRLMDRQQELLTFAPVTTESSDISLSSCLTIGEPAPELPAISTQPQAKSIALNTSATLTVALSNAANAAPLSYQWFQDGVLIPSGATQASYTTPVFSSTSTVHNYYVKITNETGTVQSNTVQVSVNTSLLPPSITSQPVAQTTVVGQTATFSVALDSTPPASTYQWFKNGATITGATAASYTTPVLTLADSGKTYSVRVTNSNGIVNSTEATLTVNAASNSADDATLRKIARFVPLNTIADNLGNGFNFLVNNSSSATALPSITYDPFFCSPYRKTTITVNGSTLKEYQKASFASGTTYALNILFPAPACTTSAQLGGLTLTGNLSTSFSYTGVNTPQSYNYTHDFTLDNASITLPNASASQAMRTSGLWHMFEERKANTTLTSRTFEPKTNAALNDLSTGLTATVSAGQIKTTVDENTQGTTTTVTYVTPTTMTVDGMVYTASGQYTLVVSAQGVVSHTGSLLLKRSGSTVAEVYPNATGSALLVKVSGVESTL